MNPSNLNYSYTRKFKEFVRALKHEREVLVELIKNDFRRRYLGSFLGVIWAFIHPAVTLFVMWFVFEVGFKTGPINNYPFFIWLTCGMLPWNFFADGALGGGQSLIENSFLVKKVLFRVSFLPLIKVLSALLVHLIFVVILLFAVLAQTGSLNLYQLQFFYFSFIMVMLTLGLAWLTAAIVPFFRDFGQLIAIVIQIGFWATPIFWQIEIVPTRFQMFIKLNPLYYVIEGYRDSFLSRAWFWESPVYTLYTLSVTIILFVVGGCVFTKLRPHYADVL